MSSLKGIIAAITTPVDSNHRIDLDRLTTRCHQLLQEGGCNGINLLGTTGEATSFSLVQRKEAMQAVAASGLPLSRFMVGTGAAALEDAVELTSTARDLGFAGALLLPPFYYKTIADDDLVGYVANVIDNTGTDGLSLYLYHFPVNSGVPYSPNVVKKLRERYPDTLAGLKDSSGDLDYSATLARELPGFAVFPSAEASLAHAEELGFAGCVSATANVTAPFAQAALSGTDKAAQEAGLAKAVRIRAEITRFPLVAAVKEAVSIVTGDPAWRRTMPPLGELNGEQRAALAEALSRAGLMASG